ncbi:HEPN domain-containing protein [Pyrobaculum islandicum]|nr:HEPN domain-containing protein [Pyrobaculum islandicum]
MLAKEAGYFPHTHLLRRLFGEVKEARPDLWELYVEHRYAFEVVEDVYIGARYLPRRYARDVAEGLLEVAKELVKRACG